MLLEDVAGSLGLEIAHVLAVAPVELLLELLAREFDLLGIDHDDVIAVVDVRRPGRLVAAGEGTGYAHGEHAEALAGGVDEVPIMARFRRRLLIGAHDNLRIL